MVNSHHGDLDLVVKYLPGWKILGFKIRQGELYFMVNTPMVNVVRVERAGGEAPWNRMNESKQAINLDNPIGITCVKVIA